MRILTTLAIALAVISTLGSSRTSQTPAKDRILRAVDPAQAAVVRGTAHPLARPQLDQGRTDPSRMIHGSITFRLSPAQQSDLDQLLRQQQDPSSPNYHRWITPDQYAERFGMSSNDLAKVSSWLQSQGLSVESISRSHNEVAFSGSAGQAEYAFKTELHNYMVRGEQHFANARAVSLPAAFSAQVLNVRGLNDIRPRARVRPLPRFTSNISGNHFIIPGDFNTIYDIPSAATGAGQKIAVVGQTNISNTDIDAFRSAAGLAVNDPTVVLVPNSGLLTTYPSDEVEADLDVEWSGAIAPAASIVFVTVGSDPTTSVFDALTYAIDQNLAPVVSISYGNCESQLSNSFILSLQQQAQQANAQGQTIVGPSGDSGAADCDTGALAKGGYQVDVPAVLPEVTGVGGTEFTGDTQATVSGGCASATTYWSGSCSQTSGASALSYIPETAWNDTSPGAGLSATGGGASTIFAKPSWQSGTGVPADGKRDVPDISVSGSSFVDPYLVCSQAFYSTQSPPSTATSCASGFRANDSSGSLAAVGGTSVGAPTFAAIMALINQATGSKGQGNANPMLYRLAASSASAFHDVTTGDNKVPCTAGSPNCPQGTTSIGFSAGAGYDLATGLGSIDVAKLITAWKAVTPAADFAIEGQIANISAPGGTANSTVNVISMGGFAGTVNLTCTGVSGAAQVGCTINPTSVSLTSGSTATSTVNITTVAGLSKPMHRSGAWFAATGGLFAAVILGGIPSKRRWLALLGLFLGVLITVGVACGGGGGSTQQKSQGTPVGNYVVTVTGTSGSTSHSATISVAVQ